MSSQETARPKIYLGRKPRLGAKKELRLTSEFLSYDHDDEDRDDDDEDDGGGNRMRTRRSAIWAFRMRSPPPPPLLSLFHFPSGPLQKPSL